MKTFNEAMEFRHACKLFDKDRKISDKKMRQILEVGRMSPSSFGMEGWKFLVITDDELKQKLKPACWNQPQITTCSHLVVILSAIENLKPSSGEPAKRFARRDLPKKSIDEYNERYANHLKDTLSSDENIYCWGARQTYIAMANMMTYAAFLDIDSCPIEGFVKTDVENILNLDTTKWQLSVIVPFGYRVNPQPEHKRLSFDEVVEFIPKCVI